MTSTDGSSTICDDRGRVVLSVSGLRYGPASEQGRDAVFALWAEGV